MILFSVKGISQTWGALIKEQKPVFTFTVNDTLNFPIFVVENPIDSTKYYATKLQTNVCNDQICLPIEVNLFWDLLGNYHHFSKEPKFNFTKFDHQFFEENDYARLNEILLDSLSPLRDYEVEDLLDKEANKFSLEIDAVTRPTSPLFSNVTVPGALYTVYTLWHIVNGPIKQKLKTYTYKVYNERKWQDYFAYSNIPNYQEYFLQNLNSIEITNYRGQIVQLLFAEDDFIPHYAIDVIEKNVLKDPNLYNPILKELEALKPHVITELINSISAANQETVEILRNFMNNPKCTAKQKEIIKNILNYEK